MTWLGTGDVINGNDTNYPMRAEHFLAVRLSSWDWTVGAGVSNLANLSTATWGYLIVALQELTGSYLVAQRILLVLWFTAIPLSFVYLFRVLTGHWRAAHLVGALAYALNPYFINAWSNVLVATIGAAVAVPLLLALAVRLLPRSSTMTASALAAWGGATVLLSLVAASPPLLAVVVAIVVSGALALTWPLNWVRAGLLGAIAIGVNAFWLVPQMMFVVTTPGVASTSSLQALGQADWTQGVSAHTSLLNVLRGAGSWDWFSDWRGEPYVSYAERYLQNPILVAVGFAIPIAAFVALLFVRTGVAKFFAMTAALGVILSAGAHPPFGDAYIWAMENVPLFGGFRSPWYKFGLAVAFGLSGLITIGLLQVADARRFSSRLTLFGKTFHFASGPSLLVVAAAAVMLYGGPLITGEVLLPDRTKVPGFRVTIPNYVKSAGEWIYEYGPGTRVLWLPRNSEVYRWGLTTGAGSLLTYTSDASVMSENQFLPRTDVEKRITAHLLDILDQQRVTEALRIARLLGVRLVVARLDVDQGFYGPNPETPAFLENTFGATREVRRMASRGRWTIYEVRQPPDRVVGTATGLTIDGPIERLAEAATFPAASSATLLSSDAAREADGGFPELLRGRTASPLTSTAMRAKERGTIAFVKAPTGRFRVSLDRADGQRWLTVRRVAARPRLGSVRPFVPSTLVARRRIPSALRVGEVFRLDARPGRLTVDTSARLGPGAHVVQGFRVSDELIRDGSFESGHWMDPIDAGPPPGLERDLKVGKQGARRVRDGLEGKMALELVSTGNRAAVYRILKARPNRLYRLSLRHRHISGGPGAFALVIDGQLLTGRQLLRSRDWTTYDVTVRLPPKTSTLEVYLYSDSSGERSVNRFDGVHAVRLDAPSSLQLRFEVVPPVVSVPLPTSGEPPVVFRAQPISSNLVADGSFEQSHWTDAIDAGPPPGLSDASEGRQFARQIRGGTEGRHALELVSSGNRAAVYRRIGPIEPARTYEVSFDHRHVVGGPGAFAVVSGSRALHAETVPWRRGWDHHKAIVHVPHDALNVSLYLYSDSSGTRSVNQFDRVRVVQLHVPEFLMTERSAQARPVRLETRRLSPTHYQVRIAEAPPETFLLTLRENFHRGWKAKTRSGQIGAHFRSSGYANGWVVRSAARGDLIDITFMPQRWTVLSRNFSLGLGLLLAAAGVFSIARTRIRRN